MSNDKNKYDLEERTAKFAEGVVRFCLSLKVTHISESMVKQLIRSVTSIGANYMEANGASSKKDFKNKIYICKKESQETKYWLRMLATCYPDCNEKLKIFWKEAQELTLIFHKIVSTLKNEH